MVPGIVRQHRLVGSRAAAGGCRARHRARLAGIALGTALGIALLAGATPVVADQTDPELDALFTALREAPANADARHLEREIWSRWSDSGDPLVNALLDSGTRAMMSGDLERAIAVFSDIIERAPAFAEGWNKRATALYHAGRLDASAADIRQTLALEPRHFGAISGMGLIFLKRRDLQAALTAFEQVLVLYPGSVHARETAARLREMLGRPGLRASRAAAPWA